MPAYEDHIKMDCKTGGIRGRGMDLCGSEQAQVTSNLADFLCFPLRHSMSREMVGFCWYKVTGKLRGSPKGAVVCFRNACVIKRQVVKQT
jgi:hypothetical protein